MDLLSVPGAAVHSDPTPSLQHAGHCVLQHAGHCAHLWWWITSRTNAGQPRSHARVPTHQRHRASNRPWSRARSSADEWVDQRSFAPGR